MSALTQAGRGGVLFRFASSVALREGRGTAFPVYTAQAPGCSLWSGPWKLRLVPVFGFSTKERTRLRLRFVPSPAEQLRQPGACRAHSPRVPRAFSLPGPSLSFPLAPVGRVRPVFSRDPPGGCRPSGISGGLWLETGGLFAVR